MDIFTNGDLKVNRVVTSSQSLPASISLTGIFTGDTRSQLSTHKFAVITGIEFSQGTNYQIMQSLDDLLYLYTFGDKPATLILRGMAFAEICTGATSDGASTDETPYGFDNLLSFYAKNKITNRLSDNTIPQIDITVGNTNIKGYLTDCVVSISDPVHRTTVFIMTVKVAGKLSI